MAINSIFIYTCYSHLPEGETTIVGASIWSSLFRALLRSAFWSGIFWWGLAIFRKPSLGRKLYVILVGLLFGFAFLLESYLLYRYQTVYTLSIAQIMAGTNPQEMREYLAIVFKPSMLVGYIALVCVLCLGYYYASRLRPRHSILTYVCVALAWSFSLFATAMSVVYTMPRTYERVVTIGQAHNLTLAPLDRLLWSSFGFVLERDAIAGLADRVNNIDLGTVEHAPYVSLPAPEDLNVVIIVGETLRRDYLHCYGYPLETTPGIDSLIATGDMVAYTDVISPFPGTIESLTSIFTYQTNDSSKERKWYDYPTLQTTLRRQGYWVSWVSNQEGSGLAVQHISTLARLANECRYTNTDSYGGNTGQDISPVSYDEEVLAYLEDSDTDQGVEVKPRGFVQIIHLMGSHASYDQRYPKGFDRFTAKDVPVKRDAEKDQIIADYANSVYYNDHVVTNIVKHYADRENTIVFYFADHGEILYDDPSRPEYYGHGLLPQGVAVPLLVYLNPQLRSNYPDLHERVVACRDRRIMLDLFTHSLTGLLGIKTKYSDPRLDFFSDSYAQERPRTIEAFSNRLVQ